MVSRLRPPVPPPGLNRAVVAAVRRGLHPAWSALLLGAWPGAVTGVAVLEHIGRRSGRTYETPLVAARTWHRLYVATLLEHPDWLRNARAAGRVTVTFAGRTAPAVVRIVAGAHDVPALVAPGVAALHALGAIVAEFRPLPR